MGSPCQLQLRGESGIEDVVHAAIAEVARLERKYSRFLDDSVTSHINRCAGESDGVRVDDETAALLDYADMGHRQSGGLFDVTSGVLRRVWDFKSGRIPSSEAVAEVLPLIGWHHVGWERPWICLPRAGMQIDLGGFVKEYAADRVAELCREQGVRHGVVDLGGDIAIIGPHPDGSPWRIGIWHPREPATAIAKVEISAGAIASSGDYERFMVVNGRRYCHLLDPRTGWPVSGLASVSVVAPHCIVAGTLATIAMLQGESGGVRWLSEAGLPHLCVDQQLKITGTLVSPQPAH
jgi:thiamine biosynthesis lipoprotein